MPLPLAFPGRKLAPLAAAIQEGPEAVEAEKAIRLITAGVATPEEVAPFVSPARLAGVTEEAARRAAIPPEDTTTFDIAQGVAFGAFAAASLGIAGLAFAPALAGVGLTAGKLASAGFTAGRFAAAQEEEVTPMANGNGFFGGFGEFVQEIAPVAFREIAVPLIQQQIRPTQAAFVPGQVASPFGIPQFGGVRTTAAAPVVAAGVAAGAAAAFRVGTVALNTVVAAMRSAGVRATVTKAVAFVRRFGPQAAVTFFAGFAGTELANRAVLEAAFIKRRRMNPGNTKALRRSIRRVQSFHRLCKRADVIAGPRRRRSPARACNVCRVNPCRC